jgi:predicted transposase YbfD/YdcC
MPKYTNKHNIPVEIIRAIENDDYTKGNADISVTGLIQPPRIRVLQDINKDKITSDYSDEVWKILGQSIHTIMERANESYEDTITEQRLFADVSGWTISGQTDTLSLADNTLKDLARDWNKRELQRRGGDYPESMITTIKIPLWSTEKQEEFIEHRVNLHQQAEVLKQMGEEPPLCNDAERWKRNDTFRVMKKGRKTALRVFDSMNDAKKYCVNSDTSADLSIEHSLGECIRCTGNYCGVAEFCNQFSEDVNE